jgi:hypothetical protein
MAVLACAQAPTIRFSPIPVSGEKDVTTPATWVIRSDEEWKKFLGETLGHTGLPPQIDFARNTVVAIFAGGKPTGGYSVRVDSITDDSSPGGPSSGTVHYRVIAPPPDALVTQAFTYPYVIVRIEKRFDQIGFQPPLG